MTYTDVKEIYYSVGFGDGWDEGANVLRGSPGFDD